MKKGEEMKFKKFLTLKNEFIHRYNAHQITAYGAQMSYFFILSLFPFLIFLVSLTSFLSVDAQWMSQNFKVIFPAGTGDIVAGYIKKLSQTDSRVVSLSILASLWSASKAISALMRAMNAVYEVKEPRSFVKAKILGILYTFLFALAIILALVLPSMSRDFFYWIQRYVFIPDIFVDTFTALRWLGVIVFLTLVIGSTHLVMPNRHISFKQALPGTVFSVLGWWALSYGFSYFVENFSRFTIVYGSLTAVIVLMIWVHLAGIVLMLGGEVNHYLMKKDEHFFEDNEGK